VRSHRPAGRPGQLSRRPARVCWQEHGWRELARASGRLAGSARLALV